jgi:aspartate-semialdehyde dehydrogenase
VSARAELRAGVLGATGALGSEVLACLDESSLPIAEIVPVASDRSLGQAVEYRGREIPVETELPRLAGLDLLFLCAPPGPSLDVAREALRARVFAIDLSGALAGNDDVPLRIAAHPARSGGPQPLVAGPPAGALAWALVLRPIAERAGLRRVTGTVLEAASVGGRGGIEALYGESLAIFNQDDLPEPTAFSRPVAFDCLPSVGAIAEGGASERERELVRGLDRLFAPGPEEEAPRFGVTVVQVPAFVGHGTALSVETREPLDPKQVEELLAGVPGVELWSGGEEAPTTRTAAGRDQVLVGRVRRDPSHDAGLLLWLAADVLRLAAANGVGIARARFSDA